jgi:hypothetical protein
LVQLLGLLAILNRHIGDGGVRIFGERGVIDRLEHAPCSILEGRVAGDAVEDEDGFDGFGPVGKSAIIQ